MLSHTQADVQLLPLPASSLGLPQAASEGRVLVIIPAYNEEASLAQVVQETQRVFGQEVHIVVVDDGSSDATAGCALAAGAALLRLPCNLGVGAGMQAGLKLAEARGYAYALRLDGDGQHNPYDARALLATVAAGEADVAIGSRFMPAAGEPEADGQTPSRYRPPAGRALGIRLFARLIHVLTGQPTTDPTSGLHAYNRRAIGYLARHHPQDYPEVEARIMLQRSGLRLVERSATMRPRLGGASSITWQKSIYYTARVTVAALIAFLRAPVPIPEE